MAKSASETTLERYNIFGWGRFKIKKAMYDFLSFLPLYRSFLRIFSSFAKLAFVL